MLTLHPHDLVRPDATIRYWTGGDTGPTVVLLHGATLDHRAWDPHRVPRPGHVADRSTGAGGVAPSARLCLAGRAGKE